MKLGVLLCLLIAGIFGCTSNTSNDSNTTKVKNDSTASKAIAGIKLADSPLVITQSSPLDVKILGIWATPASDNADFTIKENTIYYPDHSAGYKYNIEKDSIKIQYEDYVGSFLIKMNGLDTLILSGSDEQLFYRFKK